MRPSPAGLSPLPWRQLRRSAHVLPALLRPATARSGAGTRSTSARSPSTAIMSRPMLVPVCARGSVDEWSCAFASMICVTMKAPVRHVRRSCDLSSRTSSAAHSRASGILPASLKARAFAKAWLSADRSAADSFPDRAPRALRAAADVLRIATGPMVQLGFSGRQISTVNAHDHSVYLCPPPRCRCRECSLRQQPNSPPLGRSRKLRLRLRTELLRSLPAPSRPGSVSIERRT
jgi:hypothetical protein